MPPTTVFGVVLIALDFDSLWKAWRNSVHWAWQGNQRELLTFIYESALFLQELLAFRAWRYLLTSPITFKKNVSLVTAHPPGIVSNTLQIFIIVMMIMVVIVTYNANTDKNSDSKYNQKENYDN